MAEYIEREALEVALNYRLNSLMAENGEYDHYTSGFDEAVTRVEAFPAADVAPVQHGSWEPQTNNGVYEFGCTECGYFPGIKFWTSPYCPNCGAKMDGGADT